MLRIDGSQFQWGMLCRHCCGDIVLDVEAASGEKIGEVRKVYSNYAQERFTDADNYSWCAMRLHARSAARSLTRGAAAPSRARCPCCTRACCWPRSSWSISCTLKTITVPGTAEWENAHCVQGVRAAMRAQLSLHWFEFCVRKLPASPHTMMARDARAHMMLGTDLQRSLPCHLSLTDASGMLESRASPSAPSCMPGSTQSGGTHPRCALPPRQRQARRTRHSHAAPPPTQRPLARRAPGTQCLRMPCGQCGSTAL